MTVYMWHGLKRSFPSTRPCFSCVSTGVRWVWWEFLLKLVNTSVWEHNKCLWKMGSFEKTFGREHSITGISWVRHPNWYTSGSMNNGDVTYPCLYLAPSLSLNNKWFKNRLCELSLSHEQIQMESKHLDHAGLHCKKIVPGRHSFR